MHNTLRHTAAAVAAIVVLSPFAAARVGASQPLLEKIDLFRAGTGGFELYRIPGVAVTTRGTVLAYCEARKDSSTDYGEIEVYLRRSTDGGKSWEPARRIAHVGERIEGNPTNRPGGDHEQTVNNPVALVDRETGAVEFLYCINYEHCFSMRSTDDGLTWSKPVEITAAFEPFRAKYDWKVIATGPGHGIQLRSGRLVAPIWLAYGRRGAHGPAASATIFSDDHGQTWQAGAVAVPDERPFRGANESMIAQLSDGRVMLVSRNPSTRKIITVSPDGSSGWSSPAFHPDLWEPICMASIASYPSIPGGLLFSNPHNLNWDAAGNEIRGRGAKRQNLSIKLSRDDGKTWPVNKTLEAGSGGYSDLAVLPDGLVLCFYETGPYLRVARFNLAWLTDGP